VPAPSSRHRPILGIVLKLAAVVVFAGMTVCIKHLGRDIPSGQAIFVRGLISVVVLALLAWGTGRLHLLKTANWRSHALRSLFYFSLTFMLCAAAMAFQGWPLPTPAQWLLIVLAGLFGVFGQLLMTYSYRYAEASTIAPLDYSNMILAIIVGYLFFDEIPSLSVWIGAPLILGAGLIILWREYALKKQLSSPSGQS